MHSTSYQGNFKRSENTFDVFLREVSKVCKEAHKFSKKRHRIRGRCCHGSVTLFLKIGSKVIEKGRWVGRKILDITRRRTGEVSSSNNVTLMLVSPLRSLLLFKIQLQLWMKNPTPPNRMANIMTMVAL